MTVFIILVVCAILLWIDYLIAREFYRVAQMKGFSETKYLVLPFLLGIIGMLLVIALPDRRQVAQTQMPTSAPEQTQSEALPKL